MNKLKQRQKLDIEALKKLKIKRQQTLQIQLTEVKKLRNEKMKQIEKLEDNMETNRSSKILHTKEFYKNLGSRVVDEKAFSDLEYHLAKYDLDYQDILKNRDVSVGELKKIDQDIFVLNQNIKRLVVQQEKYQYISEYII